MTMFFLPIVVTGVAWAAAFLVELLLPQVAKSALGQLVPFAVGLGVLAVVGIKFFRLERAQ